MATPPVYCDTSAIFHHCRSILYDCWALLILSIQVLTQSGGILEFCRVPIHELARHKQLSYLELGVTYFRKVSVDSIDTSNAPWLSNHLDSLRSLVCFAVRFAHHLSLSCTQDLTAVCLETTRCPPHQGSSLSSHSSSSWCWAWPVHKPVVT